MEEIANHIELMCNRASARAIEMSSPASTTNPSDTTIYTVLSENVDFMGFEDSFSTALEPYYPSSSHIVDGFQMPFAAGFNYLPRM